MRSRWRMAMLAVTAALSVPAAAQGTNDSGIATETQRRLARDQSNDMDIWWNLIGLIGLLGLRGLWRASDNDGYTDDPV